MGESVTPDAMAAICQFEKTDVGARFMGKTIRVDETGELVSVKDAIVAIEGCTTKAAQMKIQKTRKAYAGRLYTQWIRKLSITRTLTDCAASASARATSVLFSKLKEGCLPRAEVRGGAVQAS
jgi:hypothetical protein